MTANRGAEVPRTEPGFAGSGGGAPLPLGRGSIRLPDNTKNLRVKLRRKYGITYDGYRTMWERQGGVCAICLQPPTGFDSTGAPARLAVDHDHTTGRVRGLLCHHCNLLIALAKEDCDRLAAAARYIVSPLPDVDGTARHNRDKSHCKHGHEFTPENTLLRQHEWGTERVCRPCRRERERVRNAR